MAKVLPHPDKFGPKNIVQKKKKKEKKGNEPKISHHTHRVYYDDDQPTSDACVRGSYVSGPRGFTVITPLQWI